MSAPEIIDFFSDEKTQPSMLDRDFSFSQETEKTAQKKATASNFKNLGYDEGNSVDDKVVWVTAIFVFFGIMIFLLGFWLGKTSIKNAIEKEKQTIAFEEKKLEEKKVENLIVSSPEKKNDSPIVVESIKQPEVATIPEVKSPQTENIKVVETPKQEKLATPKVPEIKNSEAIKFPDKKSTPLPRQEVKTATKPASQDGSYSIQVSAHTSMEKARSVEDSLRGMGLYSYLVEANVNGTTYYRVRVGKFTSREEAEATLKKLKASSYGKDSFIINLK
ncbi:MAG: SPOR domain-containing protein [Brevinematales bacterium]|nr:SPOR domain-containing protein [Brevinematales bacterium]